MYLRLKETSIDAVRNSVFCNPLCNVVSTLSTDFSHFDYLAKIHLNPLSFVTSLSYVCGMVVKSAFACCVSSAILKVKEVSFSINYTIKRTNSKKSKTN